jgi:hypothetical protein
MNKELKILSKLDKINFEKDSLKILNDNFKLNPDLIEAKNYDYYLTNSIARSSRILNKCSVENKS